ncbi:hypothetical protein IMSAGC008_00342 [Muribaculaceae bacterium]|mgnify:FL=1|nr:hypothetical protein IMSAGC008_00342 [Muribaculaceae bacterium]
MDFRQLISEHKQYTFHSHTQFCDGHAPMLDMARAAVAEGFTAYGFTPHSPIPIESPCNMSFDAVEEYIDEYRRISAMPELSSCKFYAGMEVDYLGKDWGPSHEYFKSLPLDFIIGSVHFIPSQSGEPVDIDGKYSSFAKRMLLYFRGDIEYVVHTFYRRTTEMLEKGGFDIVGHFDKVGQNASYFHPGIEDSSFYQDCIEPVINTIIDRGLTIELNTKAYAEHGRFFPGIRYLDRLVRAGVPILVNSDAHAPDRVNASRADAYEILNKISAILENS